MEPTKENEPQRESVLVVDDDPDVREGLQLFLEREGYAVSTAEDGQEALEMLARSRPGLILLDLMMPVMSGFDFLQARAQREELAAIPVVVISAWGWVAADLQGVAAVISKPFRPSELIRVVRSHRG